MLASLWEPLSLAPRRRRPPRRPHAMWRHQSSRGDRGVPRRRFAKPVRGAECDSHAAGKARGPGGEYVPEPKQPPRLGLRRSRAVSRLKPSRRGEHVCPPQPWRMKYGRRFGFCGCGAPACSSPSRSTWLVASGSPRVRLRRSADAGRICGATSVTGTGKADRRLQATSSVRSSRDKWRLPTPIAEGQVLTEDGSEPRASAASLWTEVSGSSWGRHGESLPGGGRPAAVGFRAERGERVTPGPSIRFEKTPPSLPSIRAGSARGD